MHVPQLFHPLSRRPDIEIIEARLPHMLWSVLEFAGRGRIPAHSILRQHTSRKSQLKSLHRGAGGSLLRFADQKMKVLRHDDIADHHELIALPHTSQY